MTGAESIAVRCAVCGASSADVVLEEGEVRSNVRAFRDERFAIWRCRACASIHARDEVDLSRYYARYPFHDLPQDFRMQAMYLHLTGRLRRAGVQKSHRILDYGCGRGSFIEHLRRRGFSHVSGYDAYSEGYSDKSVLDRPYDCVFSQDVIEHVADPGALLDTFARLAAPGAVIAIGTPNAAALDVKKPARYIHALHQPYHRHILSKQALLDQGLARGWRLLRYYPTQYTNTWLPFLNSSFFLFYLRVVDDNLDALMERPRVLPLLLWLPVTLFLGLFGAALAPETDVMAVFRRP